MDTGADYIEMCQMAREIQKCKQFNENWQKGDWYFNEFYGTVHIYNEEFKAVEVKIRDVIWLPRQDQLQGIGDFAWPQKAIEELRSFVKEFPDSKGSVEWYDNWEPVWLAFVMKKRFGKVWNGEQWVKERRSRTHAEPGSTLRSANRRHPK